MTEFPPPRSRRRGTELDQAILRAAVAELIESGYPGLNMDKVARRAGTNKNAIYRRWPGRAALGVAAYLHLVTEVMVPPDTGALRGDVLALLHRINRDTDSPRAAILQGLLAGIADEPELLAQIRAQFTDRGLNLWLIVLDRAIARGEATPAARHSRVATVAMDLLRHEYLTNGFTPVPDALIEEIVDLVYLPLVRP